MKDYFREMRGKLDMVRMGRDMAYFLIFICSYALPTLPVD